MKRNTGFFTLFAFGCALSMSACVSGSGDEEGDDDHGHSHDETEVISQVELTFSPVSGGEDVTALFDDPDGEGGMSGSAETITLTVGETYDLSVRFINALEDPAEEITSEIEDEAEEHQVFVYGNGVVGPASNGSDALVTHDYADVESDYASNSEGDDLVVGLVNEIVADATGTSELKLMLRHLPPLNDEVQKTPGLEMDFLDGTSLPGEVDVDVTFELVVE